MAEVIVEPIENYGLSKKNRPKNLFSRVGIVGCGTVGQSIARVVACRGIEVTFVELSEEKIQLAIHDIEQELDRQISHWGMTPGDKRIIMSRIKGTTDYGDLKGCDLVVEAILSKNREMSIDIRKGVFKKIEQYVDEKTIIATNSTTIVITELSSELEHKERCVSLHFLTTAPDARVIEVVRGLYTTDEVYEDVIKFVKLLSKTVIPVEESPGLISVRLYSTLINEACEMLMEGVGNKEDIDLTMRAGLGFAYGPFEMADRIGLDKVEKWMDNLFREFGDMKYKASPLIKRMVRANQLGRKTQKGFYVYDEFGKKINHKN
ncbi:MAG TPA: 3-hydroxyacyl-CoA dehydrogenase NAD-binding domain-containing protein [Bacteroidales bacterium]|nr:3-hydroxyacyl-CoA dehydrogenase NAD-binding domain-containing protein [Bacteroidales bacterium]